MAGHAQLKFVMTECSKTQIRLTGLIFILISGLTYSHGETFLHLKRILEKATFKDGVGDKPLETRIIEEASSCIKVLGNIAESGEEVFLEKLFKTFFLNLMYGVIFGKRYVSCFFFVLFHSFVFHFDSWPLNSSLFISTTR